jgi:hypothetical protein
MLPMGMPSCALILVSGTGVVDEHGDQLLAACRQAGERLLQRSVAFSGEPLSPSKYQ